MRYLRPSTVDEVLVGMGKAGVPLAGGTVLVPAIIKNGNADIQILDLRELRSLQTITAEPGYVQLGATVTLAQIASSALLSSELPALAQAAAAVGNPQVRNVGTLGGNLATAATDLPPALLALAAEVVYVCRNGELVQPIEQFLENGTAERLITAVRVPRPQASSRFIKFAWRFSSGKTIVSVAGSMGLQREHNTEARLVCGGVSSRPFRLRAAEEIVSRRNFSEDFLVKAAHVAAGEIRVEAATPPGEEYRRRLVEAGILQILKEMTAS